MNILNTVPMAITNIFSAELVNGVEESMHRHGFITNGGSFFVTDKPSLYPELKFTEVDEELLLPNKDGDVEFLDVVEFTFCG